VTENGIADEGKSWRERSIERSLANARAKAQSRSERFIRAAEEIMRETGSTDFTVQELVEHAHTSLRSFYQHFRNRDELLLAVFEELFGYVAADFSKRVADIDSPPEALRALLVYTSDIPETAQGQLLNRAFSTYHRHLAESNAAEYARILSPLYEVVLAILRDGVANGDFRDDIEPEAMALLITQTMLAVGQVLSLGAQLGDLTLTPETLFQFFVGGVSAKH
jgi:AcrR family transcriptional regulator